MTHPIIVFDLDGTLVDSGALILATFQHILHMKNIDYDSAHLSEITVKGIDYTYQTLAPEHDLDELIKEHRAYQSPRIPEVSAYPYARELLSALQKKFHLAIFTNRKAYTDEILAQTDLAQYFNCVIRGIDLAHLKPHTEGFEKICDYFNVSMQEISMIGDGDVDMQAGVAAGVGMTIGITHGFSSRETLVRAGAIQTVDKLEEIKNLLL